MIEKSENDLRHILSNVRTENMNKELKGNLIEVRGIVKTIVRGFLSGEVFKKDCKEEYLWLVTDANK